MRAAVWPDIDQPANLEAIEGAADAQLPQLAVRANQLEWTLV